MLKNNFVTSNANNMKKIRNEIRNLPEHKAVNEIGKMDSLDSYPHLLDILVEIKSSIPQEPRYNIAIQAIQDAHTLIAEIDRIQRLNKLQQMRMALDVVNFIPQFEKLLENIKKIEYSEHMKDLIRDLHLWLEGAYIQGLISEKNDSAIASSIYRKLTGGYKKSDLVIYFHKAAEELKYIESQHCFLVQSNQQGLQQSSFYTSTYMQREGSFAKLPKQPQQQEMPQSSSIKPKV